MIFSTDNTTDSIKHDQLVFTRGITYIFLYNYDMIIDLQLVFYLLLQLVIFSLLLHSPIYHNIHVHMNITCTYIMYMYIHYINMYIIRAMYMHMNLYITCTYSSHTCTCTCTRTTCT